LDGQIQEVSFQEALKLFSQNAFELKEHVIENLPLDPQNIKFIFDNSLDGIWNQSIKITENMSVQINKIENTIYLNYIFHILVFIISLLMGLFLYLYFVKKRNYVFEIFSLFLEIPNNEI